MRLTGGLFSLSDKLFVEIADLIYNMHIMGYVTHYCNAHKNGYIVLDTNLDKRV